MNQCTAIPNMVAHGKFVLQFPNKKIEKVDFLVMTRYYSNLEEYISSQKTQDLKKMF
jgi:hypothetical protein